MRFVTHEVIGADGMVRGMFLSRSLATPPLSQAHFPGVRAVAILPKRFDSADTATPWLEANSGTRRQRRGSTDRSLALADRCVDS